MNQQRSSLGDVDTMIMDLTAGLQQLLSQRGIDAPVIVGIHTGGAWVAKALHQRMGLSTELGTLNITFYRDDFTRIGLHPRVMPSNLPFDVDDRHIILVDDVLHTGRTIRAALNEIFDYGRPASVSLVVLVDRGGRELPIEAALSGCRVQLAEREHIKLSGPENLSLSILEAP